MIETCFFLLFSTFTITLEEKFNLIDRFLENEVYNKKKMSWGNVFLDESPATETSVLLFILS